jgi:nucleoid-associated protein YgaU
MGNLEKAGVGVVIVLLLVIMVVAFTTDPTPEQQPSSKETAEVSGGGPLAAQRNTDSIDDNARVRIQGPSPTGTGGAKTDDRGAASIETDLDGIEILDMTGGTLPGTAKTSDTESKETDNGSRETSSSTPDGAWPKEVIIKANDSLWKVAANAYGPALADAMVKPIQDRNGITNPLRLREGQKLLLPAPPSPVVARAPGAADERPAAATKTTVSAPPTKPASRAREVDVPLLPWEPGPPTYETVSVQAGHYPDDAFAGRVYVVKANESLSEIALRELGSIRFIKDIVALNNIPNPDRITAGTRLRLPEKKSH